MLTPAETLNRAADLIEQHGWTQGHDGDTERGFCAFGAIDNVSDRYPINALELLAEYLTPEYVDWPWGYITGWNDDEGQTAIGVIETMRRAAEEV